MIDGIIEKKEKS